MTSAKGAAVGASAVPDWRNDRVCVVASGPSAPGILAAVRGRMKVITINRTHELAPWADMLYAADSGFWMYYAEARNFKGLKVAPSLSCKQHCSSIHLVTILTERGKRADRIIFDPVGTIGGGGHSGFQALNIAVQTGSTQIYLAGFDYLDAHWHAAHPRMLRNPDRDTVLNWLKVLDGQAGELSRRGVRVVNLSPISRLRNYEHQDCNVACSELATLSV